MLLKTFFQFFVLVSLGFGLFVGKSFGETFPSPPSSSIKRQAAELNFIGKVFLSKKRQFPMLNFKDFLSIAKGKFVDFCLFQDVRQYSCLEEGRREINAGNVDAAIDAFKAAALFENYLKKDVNIEIFETLTKLSVEKEDFYNAQIYISKILYYSEENKWALKQLEYVLSTKY